MFNYVLRFNLNRIINCMMRPLSSYENAIVALNELQSNSSIIAQLKKQRNENPSENLVQVVKFMERTGLSVQDLDPLNVIHVTGTKGKGSTCSLTESLLRHHQLKTGFFSSPHLVHVRERIRINGEMLSEEKFATYFWLVYNRLISSQTAEDHSMPAYFKFLTIMAFHVFLAEKVDVAVIEVGIGGAYDCTNVIHHPVVCAVTTLDFDHVSMLGDSLEQIAWQKSGIFKPGSLAICADQPSNILSVLAERSSELLCPLFLAPSFENYAPNLKVGIPGEQQLENASIALQLCRLWFRRMANKTYFPQSISTKSVFSTASGKQWNIPLLDTFDPVPVEIEGLKSCKWPGRCQTICNGRVTYYLDGAHTPKSMEFCANWFKSQMKQPNRKEFRVLVFNCTSDRNPSTLLPYLLDCNFRAAVFCPGVVDTTKKLSSDLTNVNLTKESSTARCEENRRTWLRLREKRAGLLRIEGTNDVVVDADECLTISSPCITSAFAWIEEIAVDAEHVSVLIAGSLHLVGGVLSIIDPNLER